MYKICIKTKDCSDGLAGRERVSYHSKIDRYLATVASNKQWQAEGAVYAFHRRKIADICK